VRTPRCRTCGRPSCRCRRCTGPGPGRRPQVADGALGPGHDLCVHVGGLRLGAVGQQLDLVELVHPEQATGVLPGRAGLPAEAAGVGHEPPGQVRLLVDLVAAQGGEGHLRGGDGPQVVPFHVVRLVDELGEVARGHHRVGPHQRGRADLLVQVHVAVDGQLAQGPDQGRPAPRYMTNIEPDSFTARSTSRMPSCSPTSSAAPLVLRVRVGVELLDPHHDVVLLAATVGQSCAGRLGMRRRRSRSSSVMASARASSSFSSAPASGSAPAARRPRPGAAPGTACPPRSTASGSPPAASPAGPTAGAAHRRAGGPRPPWRCPRPGGRYRPSPHRGRSGWRARRAWANGSGGDGTGRNENGPTGGGAWSRLDGRPGGRVTLGGDRDLRSGRNGVGLRAGHRRIAAAHLRRTRPGRAPAEELAANVGPPLRFMLAELGIPGDRLEEAVTRYRERYLSWGCTPPSPTTGSRRCWTPWPAAGTRWPPPPPRGRTPPWSCWSTSGSGTGSGWWARRPWTASPPPRPRSWPAPWPAWATPIRRTAGWSVTATTT